MGKKGEEVKNTLFLEEKVRKAQVRRLEICANPIRATQSSFHCWLKCLSMEGGKARTRMAEGRPQGRRTICCCCGPAAGGFGRAALRRAGRKQIKCAGWDGWLCSFIESLRLAESTADGWEAAGNNPALAGIGGPSGGGRRKCWQWGLGEAARDQPPFH